MINQKVKRIIGKTIIISLIIFILLFIYSYLSKGFVYGLFQEDPQILIDSINIFGKGSYLMFFLLILFEAVFAPFPPLILYIAGGAVFGGFLAGIIALTANFIGAGIAFFISRRFARNWVKKQIPDELFSKVDEFSVKRGPISIFILRINPLTSSDLLSYAAGLTKMNFKHFLFWTTLALIPSIFLQTYLGEKIMQNNLLTKLSIIGGAIYILGFFIFYLWIKSKKIKK